jgi:hypothetical protein
MNYISKQLRQIVRDAIEYEISFSVKSFLKVDRQNNHVEIECSSMLNSSIVVIADIVNDWVEIKSDKGSIISMKSFQLFLIYKLPYPKTVSSFLVNFSL